MKEPKILNFNKDIIMSEKDEGNYRGKNNSRFCENEITVDEVRDHCHLNGKNRGPAQNNYNLNDTQIQSSFLPIIFHNFCNYDCHLFFKKNS